MLKDKRTAMVGTLVVAVFLSLLTLMAPGKALAVSAFLKVDGVDGESQNKDHKNWIELIRWSFGDSQPLDPQTLRAGKVKMQDFKFTMRTNKASPKLFEAVAIGKRFPKVELNVNKSVGATGATFLKIELKNSAILSFVSLGSSGSTDDSPMEEIMLNFETIKFTYTEFDAGGAKKGTIEASVDVPR